jgi:hypothetical protein
MRKLSLATGMIFVMLVFASVQSLAEPKEPKGPKQQATSVQVYDAGDQLVGTLVDFPHGWYNRYQTNVVGVFLPGINKFAQITGTASPAMTTDLLHFQGYDCNGQAYWPQSNYYVLRLRNSFTYYSGGDLLVNDDADWPEWSTLDADGTCTNYGCCLNKFLYEPVEVSVTDLPYVPPLTGPLTFR